MQNVFRNFIILIGMLLILVGIFGLSYTYRIDHRTARSLSAYARIDFQASYTGEAVGWDGLFAHTEGNCKLLLVTKELSVTLARAEAVLAAFGERVDVTRSADCLIEIVPKEISKASALRSLAEKLGIAIEETMAIGDAYNDLPMLKAAGKSIAMGNAFPEVKEVTDYETLTCEENGLAAAIYHYVLGMGADAPVPMKG